MVFVAIIDGNTHLDLPFKNALRYENHQQSFSEILSNELNELNHFESRIKKAPAIETVIEDFHIKWHSIVKNAKKQSSSYLNQRPW